MPDQNPTPRGPIAPWLALAGILFFSAARRGGETPPPSPSPAGPVALDLTAAFVVHGNRPEAIRDADHLARFAGTLARVLERDGKQASPRIKHDDEADQFRIELHREAWGGATLSARYPSLAGAIGAHLAGKLDPGGEAKSKAIDAPRRAAWVSAYGDVEAGCRKAAADLRAMK